MREINVETIRSVDRAIQILNCFRFERPRLTIEEIMEKTRLAKATTYRLLWTMEKQGLIQYDQKENLYRLGYKCMEYGSIVTENLDLRREAEPYLYRLQESTGYTILMAMRHQDTFQYISRLDSDDSFQPRSYVGRQRILHYGALGILLMAYLPPEEARRIVETYPLEAHTPNTLVDKEPFMKRLEQIKSQGFYVDQDETFIGFTAVTVPVFGQGGAVPAAIGVAGPSFKVMQEVERIIQLTRETAHQVSQKLGYIGSES